LYNVTTSALVQRHDVCCLILSDVMMSDFVVE